MSFYSWRMPKKDPRIDAFIAQAADFAKPILTRIRKLVHATCPSVTETIKWGNPFYEHKGILLATPAFKQHCRLVFGKAGCSRERTGKNGCITTLPICPATKSDWLHQEGRRTQRSRNQSAFTPQTKGEKADHRAGLFSGGAPTEQKALATFENFRPSCQQEYVAWIVEAKREETRTSRIKRPSPGWPKEKRSTGSIMEAPRRGAGEKLRVRNARNVPTFSRWIREMSFGI